MVNAAVEPSLVIHPHIADTCLVNHIQQRSGLLVGGHGHDSVIGHAHHRFLNLHAPQNIHIEGNVSRLRAAQSSFRLQLLPVALRHAGVIRLLPA